MTASTLNLLADLRAATTAACERAKRDSEARAAVCAVEGHRPPPKHEQPVWWERKPVHCTRCGAVVEVQR